MVHRDLKPENLLYADLSLDAPLKIGNKQLLPFSRAPVRIVELLSVEGAWSVWLEQGVSVYADN